MTENMRPDGQPLGIGEYEKSGGYQGLRKALSRMTPEDVLGEVNGLQPEGQRGGGFPTGQKWSCGAHGERAPGPKYFISNSDEMEPGAFKDRLLMEGNPHQLHRRDDHRRLRDRGRPGYIFLRWEYGESAQRLRQAIGEAYEAGYLGKNILRSGYSLDMHLHVSAGRYICGEETALLSALEGKAAIPRASRLFPRSCGLWGRPAVVNNAETLCECAPHHQEWGGVVQGLKPLRRRRDENIRRERRVKRPGAWELPMGTTIRELMEEHAGGMSDGFRLRGMSARRRLD